jgi:cell division protein FtsQ
VRTGATALRERLEGHTSRVRPGAGVLAFATRARARHRPSGRLLAGLVASLLVLALAAWVVLASPLLALREVRVTGTQRLDPAQVEALVRAEAGTPLLRLDTAGLAERIEALPLVGTAEVLRSWPRTAEVQVTERLPVAVVGAGEGVALVDVDGRRLFEQPEAPADLPELSAATERAGPDAVRAALAVTGDLPVELRAQVATVDASSADSVRLTLRSEAEVVWGGAQESELKAEVLAVLLTQDADEYDVSAPRNPVTR